MPTTLEILNIVFQKSERIELASNQSYSMHQETKVFFLEKGSIDLYGIEQGEDEGKSIYGIF